MKKLHKPLAPAKRPSVQRVKEHPSPLEQRLTQQDEAPAQLQQKIAHSPHQLAQAALVQAIAASPRQKAQQQMQASVQRSSHDSAQHKQLTLLSAQNALTEEENEKSVQRASTSASFVAPTVQLLANSAAPMQLTKTPKVGKGNALGGKPAPVRNAEADRVVASIENYAAKVRPSLEDDDDVEELANAVKSAQRKADNIAKFEVKKKKAPYRGKDSRPRRTARGDPIVSRLTAQYKEDFQGLIDSRLKTLRRVLPEIRRNFVVKSGGFGAKGRAHEMDGVEVLLKRGGNKGKTLDNSFIKDTVINGTKLDAVHKVLKSNPLAGESVGPLKVAGVSYDGTEKRPKAGTVEGGIAALNGNNAGAWNALFRSTPLSAPRGTGQYANMNNTNANGYAWLHNVPGWKTQRWEWLHVRGAGLGGATNGSNLVLGTRDANTHMIPFESNVRLLATAAYNNANYQGLNVRWGVSGGGLHARAKIGMQWQLTPNKHGVKPISGEAQFDPLHTGSNISKTEIGYLEAALKAARDGVKT